MLSQTDIHKILADAVTQKQKLAITEAIVTAVEESRKDMASLKDVEIITSKQALIYEKSSNRTQTTIMWACGALISTIAIAMGIWLKYH